MIDPRDAQIVNACAQRPHTVRELVRLTDIPIASLYRIVRRLHKQGYLHAAQETPDGGKPRQVFQAAVGVVTIEFGWEGGPEVSFHPLEVAE